MRVLIVETNLELAKLWASHLLRQQIDVECACDAAHAIDLLECQRFDVVVLNAAFDDRKSIALADYVAFRLPQARVVFVTASTFFSDGSIFNLTTNAHACVSADIPSEDLVNVIAFHGAADNG